MLGHVKSAKAIRIPYLPSKNRLPPTYENDSYETDVVLVLPGTIFHRITGEVMYVPRTDIALLKIKLSEIGDLMTNVGRFLTLNDVIPDIYRNI
jgi:hypothetical protein